VFSLNPAWTALGRCLAVVSGALIALVSLLQHVPVWVASLRGGLAWLVMSVAVKVGLAALERALAGDAARQPETEARRR